MSDTEMTEIKSCPSENTEEEIAIFDISQDVLFKLAVIAEKTGKPLGDLMSDILNNAIADWQQANGEIELPQGCQSN